MESLIKDLRLAVRGLLARPGFAAVAVLTLAFGIGANTAIFSVVHGVLLSPLGFEKEEDLYTVLGTSRAEGTERPGVSLPDFWYFREHQRSFAELSFFGWQTMTLEGPDRVEQLSGAWVGENLFRMLGVQPHLGRHFTPRDAVAGPGSVALLSFELWQRLWNADPTVLGRAIRINGEPVTLVGVMPPDTALPSPGAALWRPLGQMEEFHGRFSRSERDFITLGRLAPGVPLSQARAEMEGLADQLAEAFPASNRERNLRVQPLRDYLVGPSRGPILIAFGAVVLVLLIACTNVAHLLLVRAAGREREMAVRAALGAGRWLLVRQLLAESLVLAFSGGVLGTLVAAWLHDLLLLLEPGILPRTQAIELDAPVLLFAFAASLITGLACGLLPALRGSQVLLKALREGGRRALGGRRRSRWRALLLGSEVALALVLLTTAGLLIHALYELSRVDPGFEPADAYAAHILLDNKTYAPPAARHTYYRRLRQRLAEIPGVESVGLSTATPVPGLAIPIDVPFRAEDDPPLLAGHGAPAAPKAAFRVITPGYLETVGIPLLAGRDFSEHDRETSAPVVLVNQALARRAWPAAGSHAVGRRLEILFEESRLEAEVVGVVGNTRFAGLHVAPRPALYLPHPQVPFFGMFVVARTPLTPSVFATKLRAAVLEIDPLQPMAEVESLEQALFRNLGVERFFAAILSLFALLALVLAAAGIYGVFSYWVSQNTGEIGVRMALGARRGQVQGLVVGRGLAITVAGLAVGLLGAYAGAEVLARSFEGVAAIDWRVLAPVAALLTAVAFFACFLPARRASRVEPTVALRSE